ncbi:MAG: DUF1059 domain-containing protein [Nitrosopumilus sp.]|nr:DUF1059 domain-containing protein [Nitrosopumilus sp.]
MTKSLSCADAGKDCGWSATAQTEEELLAKATEHVKESHKDMNVTPELAEKIKSLMKDI